MKNEIDQTVERIGQLPQGVPVFGGDLDNPPCPEIGLTTDELISVALAYTQLKAELATAKQGLEHYADECACNHSLDVHRKCGDLGELWCDMCDCTKFISHARQTLAAIGKE